MIYGKNMKKYVKTYVEYFKKFHDKKCNIFRKLNTSTEDDLEFLMLLKENYFQNVTFFARIHKKLWKNSIFLPKSQRFAFSMPFNLTEMV